MPVDRQRASAGRPHGDGCPGRRSTTRSCVASSIPAHIGSARFSRAARSVSGSDPGSQPRKRKRGLEMERRHVVGGAGDLGAASAPRRCGRARASGRRTCGRRARPRRCGSSQTSPRPSVRVRWRPPRAVAWFQPSSCGRKSRSAAACSSSSRELKPIRSKSFLSREPWKRSIRTRSPSSVVGGGDEAAVAEREQVLGREEAEGRGDARWSRCPRRRRPARRPRRSGGRARRARRAAPAGRTGAPA